ncbi:PIR protein [Plasmodium ovale]|uniref:PIR protein n=1 Tax=Plasmodium ovale TaxID=36330 RepID=A0A1D3JEU1_PLAOA|nr:PIR protein [Plasmodium ovale]
MNVISEDHLSSLPSNINYNTLGTLYKEFGDAKKCEELQNELTGCEGFLEFCLNLTGILKHFDNWKFVESFNTDRCKTLKLWVYDYLHNRILYKNSDVSIASILVKIGPLWTSKYLPKVCDLFPYPLKEDLIKERNLHDYASNYETISEKLRNYATKCTPQVKDYLDKYVKQYNEIKEECNSASEKKHCILLREVHGKYKLNELGSLQYITDESYKSSPEEEVSAGHGPRFGGVQAHSKDGAVAESSMQLPSQFTGFHTFMMIAFPFFGIILFLFILYKKKIIHDTIDEENMQELLTNAYEHEDRNYNHRKNQISYHPL